MNLTAHYYSIYEDFPSEYRWSWHARSASAVLGPVLITFQTVPRLNLSSCSRALKNLVPSFQESF